MTQTNDDAALARRFWVLQNFDWLMGEVEFHRTHSVALKKPAIHLWDFDTESGRAEVE